ncbi:hypothetical protein Hanom_Chr07g00588101 [Helianthus anomalus]
MTFLLKVTPVEKNFNPSLNISSQRIMLFNLYFFNRKKRRANHCDIERCGQGRLLDRCQPLALTDARKPGLHPPEGTTVE